MRTTWVIAYTPVHKPEFSGEDKVRSLNFHRPRVSEHDAHDEHTEEWRKTNGLHKGSGQVCRNKKHSNPEELSIWTCLFSRYNERVSPQHQSEAHQSEDARRIEFTTGCADYLPNAPETADSVGRRGERTVGIINAFSCCIPPRY